MIGSIFSIVAILLSAYLATAAAHAAMQDDVDQAVVIIERFQEIPENGNSDGSYARSKRLGDPHHHQSWIHHQWQRRDRDCRCANRKGLELVLRQSVREE